MAGPAMPKVGDLVADKYEIIRLIGEGGMGSVFMAVHTLTGKRVALKWMLPELARDHDAVQRFLREAQAAGRIAHPNVVDIYDVGEHAGSYFLVMEYLHGEPFTNLMERGPLPPEQVVDILLPCLRGVAAAHRRGVIHRDLKPDNIFLCCNEDGGYLQPKVLDFGISKLSSSESDLNPRLTRTGAVMGTPYYMSPEQIRGSRNVDGRCDVYAFGVILYEALLGQVPFRAETYSALVLEIATGTPVMPRQINPRLPAAFEAVVMRAMARDPGDRYPNVTALGAALEPFAGSVRFTAERLDPVGGEHRPAGHATQQRSAISQVTTPFAATTTFVSLPRRKEMKLWFGAGLAAAFALGLAAWWTGGDPEPPSPRRARENPPAADLPETRDGFEASAAGPPSGASVAAPMLAGELPEISDQRDPGLAALPTGISAPPPSFSEVGQKQDAEEGQERRQPKRVSRRSHVKARRGAKRKAARVAPRRQDPVPAPDNGDLTRQPDMKKAASPDAVVPALPFPREAEPSPRVTRARRGRTGSLSVDDF